MASARDAEWVANPYAKDKADGGNSALVETGIQVHLASPIPVSDLRSVQHKIATNWLDDKRVEVGLDASERDAGNRDFILRFH